MMILMGEEVKIFDNIRSKGKMQENGEKTLNV